MIRALFLLLTLLITPELFAADAKVTELDALAAPSADDVLYIVNDPAGTPVSNKITFGNLIQDNSITATEIDETDDYTWTGTHDFSGATLTLPASAATQAELDAHTGDTSDAHDASAISADSTTLVGTGTDVQAVLEELDNGIADHIADTSAAHAASAVSVNSATLVGTGTDVQAVFEELDDGIADHLADTAGAHAATAISFTPAGTIAATTVQAAIEEVASEAGGADTDDQTAAEVEFTPAGNLAATDVQAALEELDDEKAATASAVMDGDAAGGVLSGTYPSPGFAADMATQAELDAHINDTSAAHAASAISADSTTLVGTGTTVQAVFEELDNSIAAIVADIATQTELDAHLNDSADAHDASAISVDSTTLVGTGTDVQAVFEELDNGIADHLADTTAAHNATAIEFTPSGNIEGIEVDAAIQELDSEKLPTTHASDADPHVGYVLGESGAAATVAAAGACERAGQIQFATDESKLYGCFDANNPVDIGAQGDAYNQFSDGTLSASASGGETFKFEDTAEIDFTVTAGSPDKLTAAIVAGSIATTKLANTVKSQALQLSTDGTQCGDPAYVQINSGARIPTIICTDNDASTIYGLGQVPDSWAGGTFTFELQYVQTAANTGALISDIAAACRSPGDTMNNTWGTEVAMDDAAVSGTNMLDHLTSGAVTPDGSCAAGDTLFVRWQMDAATRSGGTTTTVASLHFLAIKAEYTVTGGGSD